MRRCVSSFAVATTATAVLAFAAEAWAEEYLCRFEDRTRHVELRVEDPQERLPCQVIYSKENQAPRVLWRAQTDAEFCETKARELVEQLEGGGWSCRAADETRSADARARPNEAPEAGPPPPSNGRAPAGLDREELQALLQEAIARDLARLSELTTRGEFDARIAALGDLDGNGSEDAAIIMTYSNGAERMQYLVAYMFQGSTYAPVAKAAITGRDKAVQDAEVEEIEGGAIRLLLEILEPGDPDCCPSGRSRAAFVVQDGKLVEVPTS